MIQDKLVTFADHKTILAGSDTVENMEIRFSGGGLSGWGIAQSPQPWFHCIVTEAFLTLTSVRFELQYENTVGGTSWVTIPGHDTGAIVRAQLIIGKVVFNHPMPVLDELKDAERLRLRVTRGGSAATAGKINSGITLSTETNRGVIGDTIAERLPTSYDQFPGE